MSTVTVRRAFSLLLLWTLLLFVFDSSSLVFEVVSVEAVHHAHANNKGGGFHIPYIPSTSHLHHSVSASRTIMLHSSQSIDTRTPEKNSIPIFFTSGQASHDTPDHVLSQLFDMSASLGTEVQPQPAQNDDMLQWFVHVKTPITRLTKSRINEWIAQKGDFSLGLYAPHNTFIVWGPAQAQFGAHLSQAPSVLFVTPILPRHKIHPTLRSLTKNTRKHTRTKHTPTPPHNNYHHLQVQVRPDVSTQYLSSLVSRWQDLFVSKGMFVACLY